MGWEQDGDRWRVDQGEFDEEQEGERERQEGLRPDQGLDPRRDEGAEGSRREGIRRREEGHSPVQEGEGVLRPLSLKRDDAWRGGRSQLRDVGLSRILFERWAALKRLGHHGSSVRPFIAVEVK